MQLFGFDDEEIQLLEQYMGNLSPILNDSCRPDFFKFIEQCSEADDVTKQIVFNIFQYHKDITKKEKLEGALKKWISFVKHHTQTNDTKIADTTPLLTLSISIGRAVISDYTRYKLYESQNDNLRRQLENLESQNSSLRRKNKQFIQKVNELYNERFSELEDIFHYLQHIPDWLKSVEEVNLTQNRSKNNPFLINGY